MTGKMRLSNNLLLLVRSLKFGSPPQHPPKKKRIIVVGTTSTGDYLGVVLINSEINWNVHRNREIIDYQYFLRIEDCSFIDHDSYADCLNLHEIARSMVLAEVVNDLDRKSVV